MSSMEGLHFFDRTQDFTIAWKTLPHWAQAGTLCFITWRTADSLPREAQTRIATQRREMLVRLGLNPSANWRGELGKLPRDVANKARWQMLAAWDKQLDLGVGECLLTRPELSQIVEESILHFQADRYMVTDMVVMPNHAHVLVALRDADSLLSQPREWKRFSARLIQKALERSGEFWQAEQFDHLVRSLEQFEYLRRYIAENPTKAGLRAGQFRHFSADLRS